MEYTKDILEKIKYCGVLQYDIDKTITQVNPTEKGQLYEDLENPESVAGYIYRQGLNQGQFNLDAALFKLHSAEAEMQSMAVKRQKEVDKLIGDYLGDNIFMDIKTD